MPSAMPSSGARLNGSACGTKWERPLLLQGQRSLPADSLSVRERLAWKRARRRRTLLRQPGSMLQFWRFQVRRLGD